jgi:prepilin-type N-terminal cleavage/methylation domain-containing protein
MNRSATGVRAVEDHGECAAECVSRSIDFQAFGHEVFGREIYPVRVDCEPSAPDWPPSAGVTVVRRAFTLFELILVMAIILILAGAAVISIDTMRGPYDLAAAVDSIQTSWASARSHAVDEGRKYRFAVKWGSGDYRIAPDSLDFWSGGSGGDGWVVEDSLPKGIPFESASNGGSADSSGWSTVVTFLPDGTALEDASVVLAAKGSKAKMVSIRGITGVVRVRDSNREDR